MTEKIQHATRPEGDTVNVYKTKAVVPGICVVVDVNVIVYAGPIEGAPDTSGKTVFMSPPDYDSLAVQVKKRLN